VARASDLAYARLRAEIIDWELEPGTPLGEIETAERLGVSRTPVREALARLAADGLVASTGRTARVAPLSREHVIELYELREALDVQAARLAARRRDPARFEQLLAHIRADAPGPYALADELDAAIDASIDSRYLAAELQALRGQMSRVRRFAHADADRLTRATEEHALIASAILAGDESLAAHATAVHLHNSLANILASLTE
jgi:DNA-binding GntR family transcriptional regulator